MVNESLLNIRVGKLKFIQRWKLAIEDLWGNMIGLLNDGYVVIKVMCPKTLCVDGNGRK
jgi:hypothetical protein